MEIGFAIARGIPVFCTDKPRDFVFRLYTMYGKKISEIKTLLILKQIDDARCFHDCKGAFQYPVPVTLVIIGRTTRLTESPCLYCPRANL